MEYEINTVPAYQDTVEKNGKKLSVRPKVWELNDRSYRLSASQVAVKRCFDIFVALVACLVFSPAIIVIAFLIWFDDFHNPIFSQKRVGLNGKEFTIYKFR